MQMQMNEDKLYYYKGTVQSVYDGDTIRVDIDLGLNIVVKNEAVRLSRINAPEVRGEERERGLAARDYLRSRIEDRDILLQTLKDQKGKFGRYLGEVWLKEKGKYININDEIVAEGFAVYKEY
jgi:micrococcal nuclease